MGFVKEPSSEFYISSHHSSMLETFISTTSLGWIYTLFATAAVCSTFIIIAIILSENRNPVKSLAWVTVLLLLPVVGIILYFFFGRNLKNTRMISQRKRRKLIRKRTQLNIDLRSLGLSEESILQINLGRALTGEQLYPGNTVDVYENGTDKFEAFKKDLRCARHSIYIQYYIIENDNIGQEIAQILIDKATEGVKVRLIYDHVGSLRVPSNFFKKLREKGIEAYPFFKVSFPQLGTRINWRNHRKVCVIDETVGYVGGMNIADRYIDGGKNFDSWRDTHVRIVGPIVNAMLYSFAVDWNFMGKELIDYSYTAASADYFPKTDNSVANVGCQFLSSGPTSQWANIALAFNKAIAASTQRVYIQTPYFLPTDALLRVLQASALSNVDVRIMIPRRSDSQMLTFASASYIAECLRAGIKIYFYDAGMMHSKMIIIDDELVSVGSTNFDFRSFDFNFEANIFFYSRELNARMVDSFKNDLNKCTRVLPARWRKRPVKSRIAESIIRLLSPIL